MSIEEPGTGSEPGRGPGEDAGSTERARVAAQRAQRAVERAEKRVASGKQEKAPLEPAPSEATLLHRRGVAIFGGVFLLAVVVAVIVALTSGDNDEPEPAPPPEQAKNVGDREAGVEVRAPEDWERVESEGVLRFRSPEGDMQVLISSSPHTGEARLALDAELQAIQQRYEVIDVGEPGEKRVGGLKVAGQAVASVRDRGEPLRILVLTADGESHTYTVTVASRPDVSDLTFNEGQEIVNSLKLTD